MRTVGRIILWLFIGIVASVFIGFVAITSIEYQSNPKMSTGGSVFTSFWDRGFVSATGTWIIEESRQAFPRQTTEIKCYRDEKVCLSAQAEITFGDMLSLQTDRMTITSWDANIIVYTSTDPTVCLYDHSRELAGDRPAQT
jgi:hypothetical protein